MNTVYEIIEKTERTIALFTTHDEWSSNLVFNSDRTGFTGDWKIRLQNNIEIVVIYHRIGGVNNIYKADIVNIEGPLPVHEDTNRYRIHFSNCKNFGTTESNWSVFADTGTNPVRYLNV